jgi:hypothetical protein
LQHSAEYSNKLFPESEARAFGALISLGLLYPILFHDSDHLSLGNAMALSAKLPPRESRAHTLVATLIAFLVLDFIFIALRFWSRRLQWKKFRADDYFVIAALVVICAYFITAIRKKSPSQPAFFF